MEQAIKNPAAVVGLIDDGASSSESAVSWAAVFAGAVGAIAATLILIELGVALGLASVSAWSDTGTAIARIGIGGAIWLVLVQWFASALGGYLAGRLRTKWVGLHTDEVFFRDTAHGFLAWAAATLIGVAVLAGASASTVAAGAAAAPHETNAAPLVDPYYVDLLLRPVGGVAPPSDAVTNAEIHGSVARILSRDMTGVAITPEDRLYLGQVVAARAGIGTADADKRVDNVSERIKASQIEARGTADKARKAASWASIIVALSMAIGAFIASVSAALGGRLRDAF
jgi:hypothetical protein